MQSIQGVTQNDKLTGEVPPPAESSAAGDAVVVPLVTESASVPRAPTPGPSSDAEASTRPEVPSTEALPVAVTSGAAVQEDKSEQVITEITRATGLGALFKREGSVKLSDFNLVIHQGIIDTVAAYNTANGTQIDLGKSSQQDISRCLQSPQFAAFRQYAQMVVVLNEYHQHLQNLSYKATGKNKLELDDKLNRVGGLLNTLVGAQVVKESAVPEGEKKSIAERIAAVRGQLYGDKNKPTDLLRALQQHRHKAFDVFCAILSCFTVIVPLVRLGLHGSPLCRTKGEVVASQLKEAADSVAKIEGPQRR
ncbi:MAG: hypothetical protein A2X77_01245 [Gammaproteobacteria bacterium GWE2_42_36]|nr:MAG: hypothetical protein A2X77_01245 [Gammaproteobacteria bacterium GWE2_42_36]HCU05777.1 hypothetical protein [Coxiellaceae bacterium]